MGNKLCKKKVESVDNPKSQPTPFDRIINRLHLKPKWKSDSHLEDKQVNRYEVNSKNGSIPQRPPRPLSNARSSEWTEVSLHVPDDDIQLKNAKLIVVDETTPIPPPRTHKKGIRERIEAVAKSGLQALQPKKPVEEPLCIKKTIIYDCPHDETDHHSHKNSTPKNTQKFEKESKRRKNLSVVSLPNYNELKLSVANNGETIDSDLRKSVHSLPGEDKKLSAFSDKKDYISRCKSFGSSLPQLLLHKLSNAKAPLAEIESDDSFGGLEDWDLKIIEHYDPKDSSLPRTAKSHKTDDEILNDVENLIVQEEPIAPKPPVRRSESLIKKITCESAEIAHKRLQNETDEIEKIASSPTPPPSPEKIIETPVREISVVDLSTKDEEGNVEHSSLMRILQEFSVKSVNETAVLSKIEENFEFQNLCHPIDNFLHAERINSTIERVHKDLIKT